MSKLVISFIIMFGFQLKVFAQDGFILFNVKENKGVEISYGSFVLLELNENAALPIHSGTSLAAHRSIFEMRLTKYDNQILIFNDSINIPYSDIKVMHVKTLGAASNIAISVVLMSFHSLLFVYNFKAGIGSTLVLAPLEIIFLHRSNKKEFYCKDWIIIEQEKPYQK